jgi:hypothetical protein
MRQEILENMGWRFHRIWSTDWFYRRGEAVEKLKAALEDAKGSVAGLRSEQAVKVPEPDPSKTQVGPSRIRAAASPKTPPYRLTVCSTPRGMEPHQVPLADMARVTKAVVETEGPVHADEIARRVTTLFGKSRTGSLITAASLRSLQFLKSSCNFIEQHGFWMTPVQFENPPVRDRSSAPITLQSADMLSPVEIRAAIKLATQENGSLSDDEMAMAVTRLFGFKRTGPELRVAILKALNA